MAYACATARHAATESRSGTAVHQHSWSSSSRLAEVFKNYSDINLGCQMRVSSGLKWVFSHVEETIILEDDCLPHPSFFRYCEELLTKYKCDYRIMSIAGVNFQQGQQETEYSYYFSQFHDCWGWATWKRAWQHFDFEMKLWSKIKNSGLLKDKLFDRRMFKHWDYEFSSTYNGRINSWYYRWLFSCWMQSGLGIFPSVNLVSNIGFSKDATHTIIKRSYSDLPTEAIDFPIKHPPFILRDIEADKLTQRTRFNTPISIRLQAKLQKIINDCIPK